MIEEKKIGNCCLQSPDPLIQSAKYKHQTDKGERKKCTTFAKKKKKVWELEHACTLKINLKNGES